MDGHDWIIQLYINKPRVFYQLFGDMFLLNSYFISEKWFKLSSYKNVWLKNKLLSNKTLSYKTLLIYYLILFFKLSFVLNAKETCPQNSVIFYSCWQINGIHTIMEIHSSNFLLIWYDTKEWKWFELSFFNKVWLKNKTIIWSSYIILNWLRFINVYVVSADEE